LFQEETLAKHTVSLIVTLLATCLIWAGSAPAESTRPLAKKRALFKTLDKNKDGRLSRAEFMAMWRNRTPGLKLFRRLDANRNGYLTYQEFSRPWGRTFSAGHLNRRHVFKSLDADQDGALSPRELASFFNDPARAATFFKRLDRNGDNRVHWNEFGQGRDPAVMINILRW
jgi:Ca2+-binding EF-hand superfamily protein